MEYHITAFIAVAIIFCSSFSVERLSDNTFNSSFSTVLLKDEACSEVSHATRSKGYVLRNSSVSFSYSTSLTSICVEQKLSFSSFDVHTLIFALHDLTP